MKLRAVALAALLGLVLVPVGESQLRTTAPSVFVNVHITLDNAKVMVTPTSAPRGSDARFIIKNVGTGPVHFTIGNTIHSIGLQTGFSRWFKPGSTTILILFLDIRGVIPYFIGDSLATAKSKGKFLVGYQCAECIWEG